MVKFQLGDRVSINDPSWHRHGEVGTVVKVNRVTIRVQMGPTDWVSGGKMYFAPAPRHTASDVPCLWTGMA